MVVDVIKPFILFAQCEVIYNGRAASTLEIGNYLIIHKIDGSIQIQAGNKTVPRNYQGAGATLEMRGHILISKRKKETITIIIHKLYNLNYLFNWSYAEVAIIRTEKELVNKLFYHWTDYIDGDFTMVRTEFITPLGPVDLAGVETDGHHHLVEVKRTTVTIQNISQLNRYVTAIRGVGKNASGYIASPEIGCRAREYCESLGFNYIRLEF
jgi:RecB family endonuclease NucS